MAISTSIRKFGDGIRHLICSLSTRPAIKNGLMLLLGQYSCRKVAALSYDFAEGQLTVRQQKRYQKHLKRCQACLRFIRSYRSIATLGARLGVIRLTDEQKEKILQALS